MGDWVKVKAGDGQQLSAYVARPEGKPIGSLVVVQEIFGVNDHIRRTADAFAGDGFLAIAPALFDRVQPGVELRYEGDDAKQATELMGKLSVDTALLDVAAAFAFAEAEVPGSGTAVIGYCYGGLITWLSATRGSRVGFAPSCCVGYYAGGIGRFAAEEPLNPVMLHFGAEDSHIGPEQIEAVRQAHPEVQIFTYEGAEHGFNCDARASFNPAAAAVARERSMKFLKEHIA